MSAEASLRPMTPDKACSFCGEFKHGDPCDDLECPRRGRNPPVMVPRAALEFVMDIVRNYADEGPLGAGWQSNELGKLCGRSMRRWRKRRASEFDGPTLRLTLRLNV